MLKAVYYLLWLVRYGGEEPKHPQPPENTQLSDTKEESWWGIHLRLCLVHEEHRESSVTWDTSLLLQPLALHAQPSSTALGNAVESFEVVYFKDRS